MRQRGMNKKPQPRWTLAAIALFPLILLNCASTVTRQLDEREPEAYNAAVSKITSRGSQIQLKDGSVYAGYVVRMGRDTIDLMGTQANTKIPADKVSSITVRDDHGVGAVHGMYMGAMWTGGIVGLIAGLASGDFIPGFLAGGFIGGLGGGFYGLIIGAIGGADLVYEFPNGAPRPASYQLANTGQIENRVVDSMRTFSDGKTVEYLHDSKTVKYFKTDSVNQVTGTESRSVPSHPKNEAFPPPPSPAPDEFVTLEQLGQVRIVLKDGSEKKSCVIREIHASTIEYEKKGVMHDLAIDRILRFEMTSDGTVKGVMNGTLRGVVIDPDHKLRLVPVDGN